MLAMGGREEVSAVVIFLGGEKTVPPIKWLGVAALAAMILSGCSEALLQGNLFEKRHDDGRVSRLKVEQGEGWSAYDRNSTKPDETSIFLLSQQTF